VREKVSPAASAIAKAVASGLPLALLALQAQIPHVSQCNFCYDCIVGNPTDAAAGSQVQPSQQRKLAATGGQTDALLEAMHADLQHRPGQHHSSQGSIRKMQAMLQRQLRRLKAELDPFNDPQKPPELRWESYLATANDVAPKASLPNCTRCYGCNTRLTHMDTASSFFNRCGGPWVC
jgi:hypothetical protein